MVRQKWDPSANKHTRRAKEFHVEMGSTDESFSNAGYEPKDYFLAEAYAEFNQESVTEQRFPAQRFPEDVEYDDAALSQMLCNACRGQVDHSEREGLSSGLSSSMSQDRTEQLVVETGQEQNLEQAQIRTLLDWPREQMFADFQAEIKQYEFQAGYDRRSIQKLTQTIGSQQEELHRAQAEELHRRGQQLLHEQLLKQNLDLREAHEKSLNEMEEFKKFQGSIFDTITRRRLVEDQDTILELCRNCKMKLIV